MTAKHALSLVAVCLVLTGCDTMNSSMMRSREMGLRTGEVRACRGQGAVCFVKVSVSSACEISVDPELLFVRERRARSEIHWTIETTGYSFLDNTGITIHGAPSGEFDCDKRGPRHWVCKNTHARVGGYKYDVNLSGGCSLKPLDPFIMND